tara:strand:+ start:5695 stop:5907 length:213 start_codon:yes stop_codon:yes gene_type:complete
MRQQPDTIALSARRRHDRGGEVDRIKRISSARMVLRKSRLSGQEVFDFQPIDFDHVVIFQFDRAHLYPHR